MTGFFAHGYCIRWSVPLVTLNVVNHLGIFFAYIGIPWLLHRACKARGIAFPLDRLFMAFIITCGVGHFVSILLIWWPIYWFAASLDFLTAAFSLGCLWNLAGHVQEWLQMLTWPEEYKRLSKTVEDLQKRLDAATGGNDG